MKKIKRYCLTLFVLAFLTLILFSCSEENSGTAPYIGSPQMSTITIEEESFSPKITWVGGYAAVLGINKGKKSILDTSLVWLIKTDGNNLKYPVKFGELPNDAQDITNQFGGTHIDSLNEDEDYSFWVMKSDAWNQLSINTGKSFVVDSALSESTIINLADSVFISPSIFTSYSKRLDVFLNIEDISTFGQLGIISISETRSNRPLINWQIIQSGVLDSTISVIGISEGNQYSPSNTIWEVYSEVIEGDSIKYGNLNVIPGPLNIGDSLSQTKVFVPFEQEGLERNKTYYIWIANNLWGGEGRLRFEKGYAFATFNTR